MIENLTPLLVWSVSFRKPVYLHKLYCLLIQFNTVQPRLKAISLQRPLCSVSKRCLTLFSIIFGNTSKFECSGANEREEKDDSGPSDYFFASSNCFRLSFSASCLLIVFYEKVSRFYKQFVFLRALINQNIKTVNFKKTPRPCNVENHEITLSVKQK